MLHVLPSGPQELDKNGTVFSPLFTVVPIPEFDLVNTYLLFSAPTIDCPTLPGMEKPYYPSPQAHGLISLSVIDGSLMVLWSWEQFLCIIIAVRDPNTVKCKDPAMALLLRWRNLYFRLFRS